MTPLLENDTLVFGCGNPLFGDDGFGPEVIRRLETGHTMPEGAAVLDVGTSIRDFLFDMLLLEKKPRRLIVVDAMDLGDTPPGEIREIDVDGIVPYKVADFSLHQFPTTNMLKELSEETGMAVHVLVVQVATLPDQVQPGLSGPVEKALGPMCDRILSILGDAAPATAEDSAL